VIRNDDTTSTLGCNNQQHHDDVDDDVMMTSSRTWQLVCVGHAWRGVTHNCTMASYQHGTHSRVENNLSAAFCNTIEDVGTPCVDMYATVRLVTKDRTRPLHCI